MEATNRYREERRYATDLTDAQSDRCAMGDGGTATVPGQAAPGEGRPRTVDLQRVLHGLPYLADPAANGGCCRREFG